MTPKVRAKEIFNKFSKGKDEHGWALCEFDSCAKQCALILINEMISQTLSLMVLFNEDRGEFEAIELDYLTRVKQEIENYDN
jgi:hypothetical protein